MNLRMDFPVSVLGLLLLGLGCAGPAFDCKGSACSGGTAALGGESSDPGAGGTAVFGTSSGGASSNDTSSGGTSSNDTSSGGTSNDTSSGGLSSLGGAPATGGAPTCSEICTGPTPICDLSQLTCVECLSDGHCFEPKPTCDGLTSTCVECLEDIHCPADKPKCKTAVSDDAGSDQPACGECLTSTDCDDLSKVACDTVSHTCVSCLSSDDCTDAAKPQCNGATKACVTCLSNDDCKTAAASRCDTTAGSATANTCLPCAADTDCAQVSGKTVCLTGITTHPNVCVQCTGKKHTPCGEAGGKSLICDSLSHTCSTDKTVQSVGLCSPCISDAQCLPGQLCAEQIFEGQSVGYFCFWKQGDTASGAPAACFTTTNRPYVNVQSNAVSIDSETATLCTLAPVTTCVALNQYRSTSCASPSNTPSDELCGFAPGIDSKCVETSAGSGVFRCTTVCLSSDDCLSGSTCVTTTIPRVCSL